MMAGTAAKAIASSLLEHRSPVSVAGDIPFVHDVIRQDLLISLEKKRRSPRILTPTKHTTHTQAPTSTNKHQQRKI